MNSTLPCSSLQYGNMDFRLNRSRSNNSLFELEISLDSQIACLYKLSEEEYSMILNEINIPEPFRISAHNIYRDIAKGKTK